MRNRMHRALRTQKKNLSENRSAIKGLKDQSGSAAHLYHKGIYVTMHSDEPPPTEEYDKWLDLQLAKTRGKQTNITGAKLRRMVIMRRQGASLKECATACGCSIHPVSTWLKALPEGLAA